MEKALFDGIVKYIKLIYMQSLHNINPNVDTIPNSLRLPHFLCFCYFLFDFAKIMARKNKLTAAS